MFGYRPVSRGSGAHIGIGQQLMSSYPTPLGFCDLSSSATKSIRGALLGLGMIGRHHARLLQSSPRVRFAGAVDPGGDRYGVIHDPSMVFDSLEDLLRAGVPDFAIIAVPTEFHLAAVRELAEHGVNVIVEKPLAATSEEADELIEICRQASVIGAVGHVERFNPALLELRRRAQAGQVGEVFSISTTRVGPFPDRIRDVGVVKDLATHDLDLVRWLGDSPVASVAAQTQHRTGREHEDQVFITGSLQSNVSFNCTVDWLTPMKIRRMNILGEKGMLVADTLASELYFYENGQLQEGWEATQQFKGVSEGNMTRYALSRREPLLVEHETFVDLLLGDQSAEVVSLQDGLDAVRCAEGVLQSANTGETVKLT